MTTPHRETPPKETRVQARLSPRQKEILEQAAAIQGRTLSEFVITEAQAVAEKVISEHDVIVLAEADRKVFFKALRSPKAPNAFLKESARLRRKLIRP